MPKKIVIIGAVALGPKVACRARRLDPEAEIVMIDRDSLISYGGCGIPYFVGGDVAEIKELVSTVFHVRRDPEFFDVYKRVTVHTSTEALAIDRKAKSVRVKDLKSGEERDLAYDTLVLATGSSPFVPPVPGADLPGVLPVANLHHAEKIKAMVAAGKVESAVVIGGGAIGLEMAEALTDLWGVDTTVVEMQKSLLPMAFGPELSRLIQGEFEKNGVRVLLGDGAARIEGTPETGAEAVVTASGERIPCQLVIFAVGARPATAIAREAGLAVGRFGGLLVDDRLRTSDPSIYAGGDCVEVKNLLTGHPQHMPLGSMANRQGRVIATNIVGGNASFPGVVGTFCMKGFGLGVARAGLTEAQAREAGFDPAYALVSGSDRAHFYPTQKLMYMKLIADRKTRQVLGVEAAGENGDAVKARVDAVAGLLGRRCLVEDVSNLEVAYSPPYASAMDIVNAAANTLDNILDGLSKPIGVDEFLQAFAAGEIKVLDVRSNANAAPYKEKYGERWINIPQDQLADRLGEIPRDEPLAVFCNTGLRSYECQVMLRGKGIDIPAHVQGGHALLTKVDEEFLGEAQ